MKDWEYSFKPTTRAEWFQQIEKDLHSKPIESLQSEWWPGEPNLPFHHKEDYNSFVALPDHFFVNPPLILEWIEISSDTNEINKKVLNALSFGVQSIVFESKTSSAPDLDGILKDVHKDMIEIAFQFSDNAFRNKGTEQLFRQRIVRDDRPSEEFFKMISSTNNINIVYSLPMSGSWTEEVAIAWKKLRDDFKFWDSGKISIKNFPHRCILQISPETNFIKQIIQTRVLQLLWLNEVNQYGVNLSKYSPVEVHLQPGQQSDPDQYLLRVSEMALASSLTGSGSLCVHHIDHPGVPEHYRRNNRNIHHLLHLESQMSKGKDPIAGSYAIDFYTKKWTEAILAQLQ